MKAWTEGSAAEEARLRERVDALAYRIQIEVRDAADGWENRVHALAAKLLTTMIVAARPDLKTGA